MAKLADASGLGPDDLQYRSYEFKSRFQHQKILKGITKIQIITKEKYDKAKQCPIDNGIESNEEDIVLQALCYILCDKETEQYNDYTRSKKN